MCVVKLECDKCASTRCAIEGDDDESWIVCSECEARLITMGALRDEIARQAQAYAAESIRKSFARRPHNSNA